MWNAAAPPSDGEEGSFCAVEMSRLQEIKGKAFWLLKTQKVEGKKKSENTLVAKTCSKVSFLTLTN